MSFSPLIQTEVFGDVVLLKICDGVSSLADHAILNQLEEIRERRLSLGFKKLIFDLELAPFFGSSLLEVIRILWNDISTEGGQIVLCNPSTVGSDVLHIAKFDQIWPVVSTRQEAFDFLNSANSISTWPADLQVLLARYEQGPARLQDAIAELSSVQLRTPAAPGRWSVLQILCHIADFELVYADRIKRVIAEDQPTLFGGDPDDFAARLAYAQRDPDEELEVIKAVRRQVSRILKTLAVAAFERIGKHSTDGPLSLKQLLERIGGHIPHHVQFIERKKPVLLGP